MNTIQTSQVAFTLDGKAKNEDIIPYSNKIRAVYYDTVKPVFYGHSFGRPPVIYSQFSK